MPNRSLPGGREQNREVVLSTKSGLVVARVCAFRGGRDYWAGDLTGAEQVSPE